MIHVNFCNDQHFWTINNSHNKKQFTYFEVIEMFYKSKLGDHDIEKWHEEFLFYQNGNLLLDHDLKVIHPKGVYKDSESIYILPKVHLMPQDEYF
jgi:hypothetical protein